MVGLDDRRRTPASVVLTHRTQRATKEQARRLCIDPGAALHAIVRVRCFEGRPAIFERIYVPAALMPDLVVEIGVEMAEEMYVIYQERYGITIARATERLAAVAATAEEARHLGIADGAPVLEITRVAHSVGAKPVELRVSRCDTGSSRYAAEVC